METGKKKGNTKVSIPDKKLKNGDSVLIKDHTTDVWDPKYAGDYIMVPFPDKTQVGVADSTENQE